jgi:hypothetical protein
MKSGLLLIPLIIATAAATADGGIKGSQFSYPADAQAHAAALLLGAHTSRTSTMDQQGLSPLTPSAASDAQASAAALLRGSRGAESRGAYDPLSAPRMSGNAQTQAADLLRGSRASTELPLRAHRNR